MLTSKARTTLNKIPAKKPDYALKAFITAFPAVTETPNHEGDGFISAFPSLAEEPSADCPEYDSWSESSTVVNMAMRSVEIASAEA
uniref:Uncharacterized protein n=1 Tax=Plectus sambesii TaxID=2011161 RepID=A0A914XCU2_9BILA